MQFRILTIPVDKSKPEYLTEEVKSKKQVYNNASGSNVPFLEEKSSLYVALNHTLSTERMHRKNTSLQCILSN